MCTAITFHSNDFYFGRNLDLEYSYREEVVFVPRNFSLPLRRAGALARHHALIGMAYISDGFPLFYDAMNEAGLCMAGLNFPQNAVYGPEGDGVNISPFELIPYLLGKCSTLHEARNLLSGIRLAAIPFSDELPLTPLHWMIADKSGAIVAEPMADGLKIYDDPYGVMTNNPPFPMQATMLADYRNLSAEPSENRFSQEFSLAPYSRGMGALGLPGDLSSRSRFVRAAFVRTNSRAGKTEKESVSQFFHILSSVEQQRGCVRLEGGDEITVYSSCCNVTKGIYYYKTYDDSRVRGVDMRRENAEGERLVRFPLLTEELFLQNAGQKTGD